MYLEINGFGRCGQKLRCAMAKSKLSWKKKSKSSLLALEPRMLFDGAAAATPPDSAPPPALAPEALPEAQVTTASTDTSSQTSDTTTSGMLNVDPAVKTTTQLELVLDPADVVKAALEASQTENESADGEEAVNDTLAKETEGALEIQPAGFIALDVEGDQKMGLAVLKVETSLMQLLNADNWADQLYALFPGDQEGMTQAWMEAATSFRQGVLEGGLSVEVQMRAGSDILGVNGAYAATGLDGSPVIFINRDRVEGGDQGYANSVLMEEVGHWIDHQINGHVDTQGDEGERFAAYMLNLQVSELDAQRIATENDKIILTVDGKDIEVEMASLLLSGQSYKISGTVGLEANVLVTAEALPGNRTVFVSDPASDAVYSGNNVRGWMYVVDANNNITGSYYGEVSRLLKVGSTAVGLQFYVYPSGTITNVPALTLLVDVPRSACLPETA